MFKRLKKFIDEHADDEGFVIIGYSNDASCVSMAYKKAQSMFLFSAVYPRLFFCSYAYAPLVVPIIGWRNGVNVGMTGVYIDFAYPQL